MVIRLIVMNKVVNIYKKNINKLLWFVLESRVVFEMYVGRMKNCIEFVLV